MVGTTLPAVVRVVDLPVGTSITGAELFEVVQTSAGVGLSVQIPLSQVFTSIGGLPTGGATGQILNKTNNNNYSATWSNITQFVAVGTALATTGSATSIVAYVPNQGITSTQIANNAVGTNQLASSIGIASTVSVGTLLTVAGTATFNGGIVGNGTLGITGNSVLTGTFGVIGTSLLTGTVGVVGTSQFTGAFNVAGTSVVTGTMSVNGTTLFTSGTFGVVGTTLFTSGTFGVVGTTLFTSGAFGVVGTTLVTGTFGVAGTTLHTGLFTVVGTSAFTGGFNFNVIGTTLFTSGAFGVVGTTLFTSTFGVVGTATFTGAHNVVGTALFTSNAFGIVGTTIITGTLALGNLATGFLVTNATGVVTASTVAQNFVLLNTLSPNNVASTNDTSSFTSTYKTYMITFENVCPVNQTTQFQMTVATSGSNFITGSYVSQIGTIVGGAIGFAYSTTTLIFTGTGMSSSTVNGVSGSVNLYNPASTTSKKQIIGMLSYPTTGTISTSVIVNIQHNGWYDGATSPVTGVNFAFSSGNIQTGTIKIYGMA